MHRRRPWLVTGALWLVSGFVAFAAETSVTRRVHTAPGDVMATFDLVNIPVVEAVRLAGRMQLRLGPGMLVLLVGPLIVGMFVSLGELVACLRSPDEKEV